MTMGDTNAPTKADEAILTLSIQIGRLAEAIEHAATEMERQRVAGPPAAPSGPPSGPPGPSPPGGGSGQTKSTQQKMAGKVFAICANNGWDIGEAGERATGRSLGADSRKWSEADLKAVLDQFKEWGYP